MTTVSLDAANALLSSSALAALRVARFDAGDLALEVFHIEYPRTVFGRIVLRDVQYLQLPIATQWGVRMRIARADAPLPSRLDPDPDDVVLEVMYLDGAEPSAYVVARAVDVVAT